jgi:5-methyltetrahydropteroyltriglutamate--homocysteine methyltransferase
VELAVRDQIKAGVDLISDGQVRGDMVGIFAGSIPGMAIENKIPLIKGKILPAPYSIGAPDLKLALKTAKKISPDFREKSEILAGGRFKDNFKGIKGIITGPTTLVLSSQIEGFYKRDKKEEAIMDMALALKKEAEHLQDAGASLIQIDEPFISTGVADMGTAKKAVETVVRDLQVPTSMHVCGDITVVFAELLRFGVDIIDCEFADNPTNREVLESADLKGKKIGWGCIDTKTDQIETPEQVKTLIKKGMELIGEENMLVDPDCGMRMRSRDAAFSKLKIMTEAVKEL